MKKAIILFFSLLPYYIFAQSADQNYIKTTVFKTPIVLSQDINTGLDFLPVVSDELKNISISYFDGLGRPIQQVAYKQSNSGYDIVTPIQYDSFGRKTKNYLPYTIALTPSMDYRTNALSELNAMYNTAYYENTTNPFSESQLELSPLDRLVKQSAPGNVINWAMGSNHEIRFDYQTNTALDGVKLYTANAVWSLSEGLFTISLINSSGTLNYLPNQLNKTVTKDENWTFGRDNTTEEFKNKEGKVVLKRTYNLDVAHDTYYIYDQYGNLTYVLPPLVNTSATITAAILDGLCYQHKYDTRNRLVEKKLPGKQWEFIVYDKLDRVVATGPVFSPFTSPTKPGWMITKYDAFNRTVYTGWVQMSIINSTERKNLQTIRDAATSNFNETKIATTTDTTIGGIAFRYTNVAIPTTNFHVLSVNYYDDYNFPGVAAIPTTVETQTVFYNLTVKPKGLQTGSYVRVPETDILNKAVVTSTFYDSKARAIRTYSVNYLGGYTQIDTKFDFIGKVIYSITTHKRITSATLLKVKEAFTYSSQDRLITHTHQINDGTIQLLSKNEYDEMGQLILKSVGGTDVSGINALQKVDYTYNIRGWLKGINNTSNLTKGSDPLDLFAFKISYNNVDNIGSPLEDIGFYSIPLYNGNISETQWRTATDNILRKYSYEYDTLNRLTNSVYQLPLNAYPIIQSYDERIVYDKNGNINNLFRNGNAEAILPPIKIDDLTYNYDVNSNKLIKVTDNPTTAISGFIDGANLPIEYTYDANGNMITDVNKGITSITYNHLNLPIKINFGSTNFIQYLYDGYGIKLAKIVTQSSVITTTDYLDGFQYKKVGAAAVTLDFFAHNEGYADNNFNYVFQFKDHLGNLRLSYGDLNNNGLITNSEILEENNFYPFGLKHNGYNNNINSINSALNYKFGGNEFQDELGLNVYDYDNRIYDQAIGRFWQMDPLAEQGRRWSPYNYCFDNPIYFQDPDGMWPWPTWNQIKSFASGVSSGAIGYAKNALNTISNAPSRLAQGYSSPKEALKLAVESHPINMVVGQFENTINGVKSLVKGDYKEAGKAYGNQLAAGITILATDGLVKSIPKGTGKATVTENASPQAPVTNEIYSRPNNATIPAQRASVQGETCVNCGGTSEPMVADHKTPLVQEHYQTGTINTENMRSVDAVQPQCTTCSAKQGAEMSKYSKEMKAIINERTVN